MNPAPPDPEAARHLRGAALWLTALFSAGMVVAVVVMAGFPNVLFASLAAFLIWAFAASLIQYLFLQFEDIDRRETEYAQAMEKRRDRQELGADEMSGEHVPLLPTFAKRWQWVIAGAAFLVILSLCMALRGWEPFNEEGLGVLRFATVAYLVMSCLFYFFANFANTVQTRLESRELDSVLILARMAFWLCLGAAGIVFLFLSTNHDFSAWPGWPVLVVAVVLAAEPIVRFGLRFYQPKGLRTQHSPAGNSLLLDAAFGHGHDLKGALRKFEGLAGMRLGDMWMVRFLRRTLGAILAGTLLLGWLSTCLTAVPAGSRGVGIRLGHFENQPLNPGLHVSLPWPLGKTAIVPTERIRTVSLGFDRDLDGALLWNEKHFEGEKNLLVGDGEALLTINVPILYRVSDPVAYLKTVANPEQALADLAERKLLHVMGSRELFSVMIEKRESIAKALDAGLQKEINALGIGIEVVFVGLKDVHPPVDVAPAYQEVVSAQEGKETLIDTARAMRARTLPAAQADALNLTTQAGADATARLASAQAAATKFLDLAAVDEVHADLVRTQLRLDAIDAGLAKPTKILVGIPANRTEQFYLDLRNTNELPPPP